MFSTLEDKHEFVKGLRGLANFVEAHPWLDYTTLAGSYLYVYDKEQLAAIGRVLGSFDKIYSNDYFSMSKSFSKNVTLVVSTPRENVCEKRVVGKRIEPAVPAREALPEREVDVIEWVCPDGGLLSHGVNDVE